MIDQAGSYTSVIVDKDLNSNQIPQFIVKGGVWFVAEVAEKSSFSLVGCTVSPDFNFQDFDMPKKQLLLDKFPDLKDEY